MHFAIDPILNEINVGYVSRSFVRLILRTNADTFVLMIYNSCTARMRNAI